jgi:hypothetical protein
MLDLQLFMDRVVDGLVRRDADSYVDMIELPYVIMTASYTKTITSREDLVAGFEKFVSGVKGRGVTDLVRVVRDITPLGPTMAVGSYETHLMKNGQRIVPVYTSFITLRLTDGVWRAICTTNEISHTDWHNRTSTPDLA